MSIPKQGEAREEFYTKTKKEQFGLNKRTRRIARGHLNVTKPDGTKDERGTGKA